MPIDKLSANAFATGAVANSLGYTPANLTGDNFTGAVVVSNTLTVANSSANVVYMAANGNVGIGTASPTQKLQVESSANLTIQLTKTGVASFLITNNGTDGTELAVESTPMIFKSASTERMRVASNGNIGIGTTSPGTKLAIVSNSSIQGLKITSTNDWGNISTPFVDIDGNTNSTGDGNILRLKTGAARTDNKIFEIVNGNGTLYYIRGDGLRVRNSVAEQLISFDNMAGTGTYNYDITVGNEGGAGNLIEVHAMFDHFYNFSYGAGIIAIIGKRQNSIQQQNIWNYTSGNGGSWSFSAPNSTTLRITKNAGSYSGAGYGHILVRWMKFDGV